MNGVKRGVTQVTCKVNEEGVSNVLVTWRNAFEYSLGVEAGAYDTLL